MKTLLQGLAVSLLVPIAACQAGSLFPGDPIPKDYVARFAKLAIEGIPREYPNKLSHVMTGPDAVQSPRELHPVFYGCFDWHSSVHGHWMLIKLLKMNPDADISREIRELLNQQLTAKKLAQETAYFEEKEHRSFERMYGWAWALRLATELKTWDDPDGRRWAEYFSPLEKKIVALTKEYLPKLTYPIRIGEHTDTAFALGQILDYARAVEDHQLADQIVKFCRQKYLKDTDYPGSYEPSGHDFFSQAWNEADLMRRVLTQDEFSNWLGQFLPGLARRDERIRSLLTPAIISDPSDPKIVHLAGLNLSRAWTQNGVLQALPKEDPRCRVLRQSIAAHTQAGLDYVFSGHYEGEHWLATFAVYTLTEVGIEK